MPLPTFKKQDEIPEAFRSEYEEKDGEWRPKVVATDTTALTTALDKERQKAKDEKKARETAEAERDALRQAQEARDKGISAEELQKIKDAEALARKPIETERDALREENRKLKLTDRVRLLALEKGVMKERIKKAMRDLEGRLDLASDGTTIVVKDENGNVTTESIDEFLATTYKKEAPFYYEGPGGSGGGGEQAGDGGGTDAAAAARATGKAMGEAQKKANTEASALARR